MSKHKTETTSFEEALSELEALVERMESGDLTLEESLAAFEQGISLTRHCQEALQVAEQKVEILSARTPDAATEPFDDDA
jgi:exodeoxyribonuclease VII small subunit